MEMENVSRHDSTNELYKRTKDKGIETVWDRYKNQQPQCGFGMQGICCQLCSHGPCRITKKADRGICGATRDTIVARNLVRLTAHGAAAYTYHVKKIIKTLRAAASGEGPYTIKDEEKLRAVASAVGLDTKLPTNDLVVALCDVLESDLHKDTNEPSAVVQTFAPKTRLEAWEKLNVIPGGIQSEIVEALTKSMTSIDTDPVDLLLTSLRLSIATGYSGLVSTITLQDILLGTPQIVKSQADVGVIDKDYVNIVSHGHIPLVGTAVMGAITDKKLVKLAKDAGAKGIKIYGSMCSGQELMQRLGTTEGAEAFGGQTGNWLNQEYLVATGAVDLMMLDKNCSTPGLKVTADNYHTKLISVDQVARMEGVEKMDFDPLKAGEQAQELVKMAIESYKNRGDDIHIPEQKQNVVSGFGVESIRGALGGSFEPLLDAIKAGKIKGAVAVVGCTNTRHGHDKLNVKLTKELIKRDILVINAGCCSSASQVEGLMDPTSADEAGPGLSEVCKALGIPPTLNFGSCVDIGRIGVLVTELAAALGVDPSQLPVAASAPEYLEQKAVADGIFAVAFGLLTHLGTVPPVTGSPLVTKTLTEDIENLTGGKLLVDPDPVSAANKIEEHIMSKRVALGLESEPIVQSPAGADDKEQTA
jgi:carbon-monoxide dehydrogenase catalytic subunit